jgi:hypothetical protein
MSFENKIKSWVEFDNQIKTMNENLRELRESRNKINDEIIQHAKNNNLIKASIEIKDSKLKFVNTKITNPLSLKYIEKCLKQLIMDDEKVSLIVEYIKENREFKEELEIKRIYNKE